MVLVIFIQTTVVPLVKSRAVHNRVRDVALAKARASVMIFAPDARMKAGDRSRSRRPRKMQHHGSNRVHTTIATREGRKRESSERRSLVLPLVRVIKLQVLEPVKSFGV